MLQWDFKKDVKSGQLYAHCIVHSKQCPVGTPSRRKSKKQFRVEAAGPTCCPFSVAGKQKKDPSLAFSGDMCDEYFVSVHFN